MSIASKTALVWGVTGQLTVIKPILEQGGYEIILVLDNDLEATCPIKAPFIAGSRNTAHWLADAKNQHLPDGFVVAIGGMLGKDRLSIAARLKTIGILPITLVHHTGWVADSATVGDGCHILAQTAICENAVLGEQVIVNTCASVDHDCVIGSGVHIMPGATLAGCVEVDDGATIGSNATILPRIKVGRHAVVGAGAVVTRDVPPGVVVKGNPARQRQ